jgi:hypothetical protein
LYYENITRGRDTRTSAKQFMHILEKGTQFSTYPQFQSRMSDYRAL